MSAASALDTARAMVIGRPATNTPEVSFSLASTAAFAASDVTKSTNAVPLCLPVALSLTTRQLLTRPNFIIFSLRCSQLASRGKFRTKTVKFCASCSSSSALIPFAPCHAGSTPGFVASSDCVRLPPPSAAAGAFFSTIGARRSGFVVEGASDDITLPNKRDIMFFSCVSSSSLSLEVLSLSSISSESLPDP